MLYKIGQVVFAQGRGVGPCLYEMVVIKIETEVEMDGGKIISSLVNYTANAKNNGWCSTTEGFGVDFFESMEDLKNKKTADKKKFLQDELDKLN